MMWFLRIVVIVASVASQEPTTNADDDSVTTGESPTRRPTNRPTDRVTRSPTRRPTRRPTMRPTASIATVEPTRKPTRRPTEATESSSPTRRPTEDDAESSSPTRRPTEDDAESSPPTRRPTEDDAESSSPTRRPTEDVEASMSPTRRPTEDEMMPTTSMEGLMPTFRPTVDMDSTATIFPTEFSTNDIEASPTIDEPGATAMPTVMPSTPKPSYRPTFMPMTAEPTSRPTYVPTPGPTEPTVQPSASPTTAYPTPITPIPTQKPTAVPTSYPTFTPTSSHPTTAAPTISSAPTATPTTSLPSQMPTTALPTALPTQEPDVTVLPTNITVPLLLKPEESMHNIYLVNLNERPLLGYCMVLFRTSSAATIPDYKITLPGGILAAESGVNGTSFDISNRVGRNALTAALTIYSQGLDRGSYEFSFITSGELADANGTCPTETDDRSVSGSAQPLRIKVGINTEADATQSQIIKLTDDDDGPVVLGESYSGIAIEARDLDGTLVVWEPVSSFEVELFAVNSDDANERAECLVTAPSSDREILYQVNCIIPRVETAGEWKLTVAIMDEITYEEIIEVLCPLGQYLDLDGRCKDCFDDTICEYVGLTLETIQIKDGYWRASPTATRLYDCDYKRVCHGTETEFDDKTGIASHKSYGNNLCRKHHRGILCEVCVGYSRYDAIKDRCQACGNSGYRKARFALVLAVISAVFILLVWLWATYANRRDAKAELTELMIEGIRGGSISRELLRKRQNEIKQRSLSRENANDAESRREARKEERRHMWQRLRMSIINKAKILIAFLQILSAMPWVFQLRYPAAFDSISSQLSFFNFDIFRLISFKCLNKSFNFFGVLVVSTLTPIAISFLILLVTYGRLNNVYDRYLGSLVKKLKAAPGYYLIGGSNHYSFNSTKDNTENGGGPLAADTQDPVDKQQAEEDPVQVTTEPDSTNEDPEKVTSEPESGEKNTNPEEEKSSSDNNSNESSMILETTSEPDDPPHARKVNSPRSNERTHEDDAMNHDEAREAARKIYSEGIFAWLLLTFIVFPSVSTIIFQFFSCTTFREDNTGGSGVRVLQADYSITCTSPAYRLQRVYALFALFVYPIGIPLTYFILLWTNREKVNPELDPNEAPNLTDVPSPDEDQTFLITAGRELGFVRQLIKIQKRAEDPSIAYLSFLFDEYEPRCYLYSVLECIRRLVLSGLLVFLYPGSSTQLGFATLFAIIFAKISSHTRPYIADEDDLVAEVAAESLVIFFFLSLMLYVSKNLDDSDKQTNQATRVFANKVFSAVFILFFIINILLAIGVILLEVFGYEALSKYFMPVPADKRSIVRALSQASNQAATPRQRASSSANLDTVEEETEDDYMHSNESTFADVASPASIRHSPSNLTSPNVSESVKIHDSVFMDGKNEKSDIPIELQKIADEDDD